MFKCDKILCPGKSCTETTEEGFTILKRFVRKVERRVFAHKGSCTFIIRVSVRFTDTGEKEISGFEPEATAAKDFMAVAYALGGSKTTGEAGGTTTGEAGDAATA